METSPINKMMYGIINKEIYLKSKERLNSVSLKTLKEIASWEKLGDLGRLNIEILAAKNLIAERNEKGFRDTIYSHRLFENFVREYNGRDINELKIEYRKVMKDYPNNKTLENKMRFEALLYLIDSQNYE